MERKRFFTIRHCEYSDIDALIEIFQASVRACAPQYYSESQCLAWAPDDIDRRTWFSKRSQYPTWVAVVGPDIAGFIDLRSDGYIDMLYIHPKFQRHGIARALLETVEKAARQCPIERLSTEASIAARPVFEAAKFSVVRPQTVFHNDQSFLNFYMQKLL